jgi:hypothetical protein
MKDILEYVPAYKKLRIAEGFVMRGVYQFALKFLTCSKALGLVFTA